MQNEHSVEASWAVFPFARPAWMISMFFIYTSPMVGVGSPNMDGMPHAHNPQAGEERILDGIEKIDILKERYRQAVEYMDWFQPAWDGLTEDDKYVLECFYQTESSDVNLICDHFGIERSSAYNKKNRALDKLVTRLYGKD